MNMIMMHLIVTRQMDHPTIILNPVPSVDEEESGKKQSSIDEDYLGFSFRPEALVNTYKTSREAKDEEPSCFHTASGRLFVKLFPHVKYHCCNSWLEVRYELF